MPAPRGLRVIEEVVPKLGAKAGFPALRIESLRNTTGPSSTFAGSSTSPAEASAACEGERYGLVLCFSLEDVEPPGLARELVRVTHPDGAIWIVVWKKDHLPPGSLSWDEAQRVMLTTPWVDNKVLSLGEQVYATRYVRRRRPAKT